jgi:hypothetical protein
MEAIEFCEIPTKTLERDLQHIRTKHPTYIVTITASQKAVMRGDCAHIRQDLESDAPLVITS